jgi:hypothetical protein
MQNQIKESQDILGRILGDLDQIKERLESLNVKGQRETFEGVAFLVDGPNALRRCREFDVSLDLKLVLEKIAKQIGPVVLTRIFIGSSKAPLFALKKQGMKIELCPAFGYEEEDSTDAAIIEEVAFLAQNSRIATIVLLTNDNALAEKVRLVVVRAGKNFTHLFIYKNSGHLPKIIDKKKTIEVELSPLRATAPFARFQGKLRQKVKEILQTGKIPQDEEERFVLCVFEETLERLPTSFYPEKRKYPTDLLNLASQIAQFLYAKTQYRGEPLIWKEGDIFEILVGFSEEGILMPARVETINKKERTVYYLNSHSKNYGILLGILEKLHQT